MDWIGLSGTVGAIVLPLFNIPLIIRIVRRKSAEDLSILWVMGVWVSTLLMTPQAFRSTDLTFRAFGIFNVVFFSAVVFVVFRYHKHRLK